MITARCTYTWTVAFVAELPPPAGIHTVLIVTIASSVTTFSPIITSLSATYAMDAVVGALAYTAINRGLHPLTWYFTRITHPSGSTVFTSWNLHSCIAYTPGITVVDTIRKMTTVSFPTLVADAGLCCRYAFAVPRAVDVFCTWATR